MYFVTLCKFLKTDTNINKRHSYFIFHEKYLQLIAYQRWTFPKIIYSKNTQTPRHLNFTLVSSITNLFI